MFFPTRTLTPQEYPQYFDHLCQLSTDDLHRRFLRVMKEDGIKLHVDGLYHNPDATIIVHHMDDLSIDGAVELISYKNRVGLVQINTVELAISVISKSRGKGMADELVKRAILHAEVQGADQLVLSCSPMNWPMRRLAMKNGMQMSGDHDERSGRLPLGKTELRKISYNLLWELEGDRDLRVKKAVKKAVDVMGEGLKTQQAILGFMKRALLLCPPVGMIM